MVNNIVILVSHYIADFIMQTQKMASNKYKRFLSLFWHVVSYFCGLYIIMGSYMIYIDKFNTINLLYWTLFNSVLHFGIDALTSQLTHYYSEKKSWHNFFVIIGFDQLLHTSILLVTSNLFLQI